MAASTQPPPPLAEEEAGTEAPPAGVPPLVVLYLDWCKPVCTAAYAKTVLALVGELVAMARAGTGNVIIGQSGAQTRCSSRFQPGFRARRAACGVEAVAGHGAQPRL